MVILIWFELGERARGRRKYAGEALAERGRSGAVSNANKPTSLGSPTQATGINWRKNLIKKSSSVGFPIEELMLLIIHNFLITKLLR